MTTRAQLKSTVGVDNSRVTIVVNGTPWTRMIEVRMLLSDFIRDECGLKGTHLGCETGECGACTVLLDGESIRSCLQLAVQGDGSIVTTIEDIDHDGRLRPLQDAFIRHHAVQCGYCTPGLIMTAVELANRGEVLDADEVRVAIAGNLCRCTGYEPVVAAIREILAEDGMHESIGG